MTTKKLTLCLTTLVLSAAACGAEPTLDESTELESAEFALAACGESEAPAAGGTITRSGSYSSAYDAGNAFDASAGSMWISAVNQTPAWLGYQWNDGARTITSYAISFANGSLTSRAPRDWTLQGFDGQTWKVVDTRVGQTEWAGADRREYPVANPGAYSAYRLNITDDNDARAGVVVASVAALELYSCKETHTQAFYMLKAGLPAPWQIGDTKEVQACDLLVEQGAGTFDSGKSLDCKYQPPTGWQIVSSRVDTLENMYGRGSYSSNVIAAGGQFTLSLEEFGNKWDIAYETALSFDDLEVTTKLDLEFQKHKSYFDSVYSNNNTFYLVATANGGAFRKSKIHVVGYATIMRVM